METIIIKPKNKKEFDFLKELLSKLNISIKKTKDNNEFMSDKEQKEIEKELQDPETKQIAYSKTIKL